MANPPSSSYTRRMIRLETTAFLPAPPAAVWAVLTDFPGYGSWNPGMTDGTGSAAPGATIGFTVAAPDGSGRRYPMKARIVELDAPRALAWRGGMWPLLVGRHYFRLEAEGDGTRLIHGEDFAGLYPWWVGRARIEGFRPYYEAMNHGLAAYLSAR